MTRLPPTWLIWFAALGGALAWATQFVANLFLTFAQCNQIHTHRRLPLHELEVALSAAAIVVTLGAEGVAVTLFRRAWRLDDIVRSEIAGKGAAPPVGRIAFLSVIGLLVNFLALSIIVLTAIGAPLSAVCQQS
ncbi:MAG TPA: hypothetical protein VG223_07005 [Solirubrobacteraceae bacterium]|jgi:hypothetical protein|nr:hypothetical protein [Solirubrobacteraceae bacterium]